MIDQVICQLLHGTDVPFLLWSYLLPVSLVTKFHFVQMAAFQWVSFVPINLKPGLRHYTLQRWLFFGHEWMPDDFPQHAMSPQHRKKSFLLSWAKVLTSSTCWLLQSEWQGEKDDKIIAVCADDPEYRHYKDIKELPPHRLAEIRRFFEDCIHC